LESGLLEVLWALRRPAFVRGGQGRASARPSVVRFGRQWLEDLVVFDVLDTDLKTAARDPLGVGETDSQGDGRAHAGSAHDGVDSFTEVFPADR
jgi:hypothetical protein